MITTTGNAMKKEQKEYTRMRKKKTSSGPDIIMALINSLLLRSSSQDLHEIGPVSPFYYREGNLFNIKCGVLNLCFFQRY